MSILDDLNPQQQEAVQAIDGPVLIFAGAGSGKTRVLTYRIAYLIHEQDIAPENILAVTFTNKAADEMRERIAELVGEDAARLWAGTFHSFCARMLRTDGRVIGIEPTFTIYDEADQRALVKETLSALNIDSEQYSPENIQWEISQAKNELQGPSDYAPARDNPLQREAQRVYRAYQRRLRANNALDFDDLIMNGVRLLQESALVREHYQNQYRYVLVDEYQDINFAQFSLIGLLSGGHRNLCVVGDDDQSIYGWRGANIRLILAFEEHFPDARTFKLEQNYRSTSNIIQCAHEVIKHNQSRADKQMWTDNAPGNAPVVYHAVNEQEEAEWVVGRIHTDLLVDNADPGDYAILYRTNAMSRILEETLLQAGIAYEIVGGTRFYDRAEIKDVVAYLKALYNLNDSLSLRRIINRPTRGIGARTMQVLDSAVQQLDKPLLEVCGMPEVTEELRLGQQRAVADFYDMMSGLRRRCEELSLRQFVQEVVTRSDYLPRLQQSGRADDAERADNVREFITAAARFESSAEEPSLGSFLEHISLISDIDQAESLESTVSLMTLHSAKGLEFPVVFLVGCEEEVLPHYRSMGDPAEIEEERRLCYVGMTRAQQRLYLSHCSRRTIFGDTQHREPSRFLGHLPDDLIQHEGTMPSARRVKTPQLESEMAMTGRRLDLTSILSRAKSAKNEPQAKPSPEKSSEPAAKREKTEPHTAGDYSVGDRVKHSKFGEGMVVSIKPDSAGDIIVVAFPDVGIKKLLAEYAGLEKV